MDTVPVRCPSCETLIHLSPRELVITAWPSDGEPGRLALGCTACHRRVTIAVDEASLVALRLRGSRLAPDLYAGSKRTSLGGRADPDLPPLNWDDLLDFHVLLQQDDWFQRLCESV